MKLFIIGFIAGFVIAIPVTIIVLKIMFRNLEE
jgi:hypothetical protein